MLSNFENPLAMNPPALDLLDLLLRAATATLNCLMAAQFARLRPWRTANVAGALFGAAIASYALISSPQLSQAMGAVREPLIFLAAFTTALFWLFALALFRDDLQWRWSYATPFLLLLLFYLLRRGLGERTIGTLGHQVTVVVLLLHVLSIAVREFQNDLMDSRRRFRLAVALVLPAVGLVIAAAETYALFRPLPGWLGLLQASALLVLAGAFALWLTAIKPDILAMTQPSAPRLRPETLTAAESIELDRLQAAIAGGICLETELSLATLAARLKLPEHRLRRLINKGLGYRNFSAFLNDHRVTHAKCILADPAKSREQIVAVAFELGYASLAPFNRAFRGSTGMTPSEYRAQALARVVDSRNS
jgi:AraC-like DNA-binding protein